MMVTVIIMQHSFVLSGSALGKDVLMDRIQECLSIREEKEKMENNGKSGKAVAKDDDDDDGGGGMGTMVVQGSDDDDEVRVAQPWPAWASCC